MSAANLIGPLVSAYDVEQAIVAHLGAVDPDTGGTWYATGLAEVERNMGFDPGQIQRPLGFVASSDFAKWPEDQIPVVLILCPGLAGPPIHRGDGSYEARWAVGISPIVSDVDEVATRKLAQAHGAAVRWAMVAKPSLGGFAAGTVWRDETYGDIPHAQTRSLGAARAVFEVIVEAAVKSRSGPAAPLPDGPPVDPGPWPTATSVITDVKLDKITESVLA